MPLFLTYTLETNETYLIIIIYMFSLKIECME